MATSIRSYSKINLGLAIGPSRSDGYHSLTTLYQTLGLHDVVTVEASLASKPQIQLSSNHPRVPLDTRNTAWQMVDRALNELRVTADVRIHIEKNLPVQGGLGAGSANAVAALAGLEAELERQSDARLSQAARFRLASETGSDVPLFLIGGTVLGVGRGEEVYPLADLPSLECVVALPDVGVSTPQAFRDWDAHTADALTGQSASATIEGLSRSIAAAFGAPPHSSGVFSLREDRPENPRLALVRTGIENDFEQVVFLQHPFLGTVKRVLCGSNGDEPAVYAALSGSGSALFGLYATAEGAEAAVERLRANRVVGLRTRTVARDEYWRTMRVM
jgi:4-diphosphocytidyl-2-C-methyl-D-erythritol kinase